MLNKETPLLKLNLLKMTDEAQAPEIAEGEAQEEMQASAS